MISLLPLSSSEDNHTTYSTCDNGFVIIGMVRGAFDRSAYMRVGFDHDTSVQGAAHHEQYRLILEN